MILSKSLWRGETQGDTPVSPSIYRRRLRLRPRLPRVTRFIAKLIHSPIRERTRGSSNRSSMLGDGTACSFSSSSTRLSLLLWFVLVQSLSRDTWGLLLPPRRLPICKIAQRKSQNAVYQGSLRIGNLVRVESRHGRAWPRPRDSSPCFGGPGGRFSLARFLFSFAAPPLCHKRSYHHVERPPMHGKVA